ncbi:MAG: DUF5777 family beta-barrel protein, partial [Bacteroidota bacterium]
MKNLLAILLVLTPLFSLAQENNTTDSSRFTTHTFNGTRVVNFQSVEVAPAHNLEFMIQHRLGEMSAGINSFFGLDNVSSIRVGFGYSIDGRLELGAGISSVEKLLDGYIKYRWLRQTKDNSMPISLTLLGGMYCTLQTDPNAAVNGFDKYHYTWDRVSYSFMPLVARKFSDRFSAQLSPAYVHFNMVDNITDKNEMLAMGFAGRYRFSKRMSLTLEYGLRYKSYTTQTYYNTFGLGWDIQTDGHV